jgi:hypothetical protein
MACMALRSERGTSVRQHLTQMAQVEQFQRAAMRRHFGHWGQFAGSRTLAFS